VERSPLADSFFFGGDFEVIDKQQDMVVSGGDCGIMGMRHGILVGTHTVTNNMICGCVCQGLAHTSWLAAFPAQGFLRCQRVREWVCLQAMLLQLVSGNFDEETDD